MNVAQQKQIARDLELVLAATGHRMPLARARSARVSLDNDQYRLCLEQIALGLNDLGQPVDARALALIIDLTQALKLPETTWNRLTADASTPLTPLGMIQAPPALSWETPETPGLSLRLVRDTPHAADNLVLHYELRGFTSRLLRGLAMPDLPHVFDEFAAALQFPYYFDGNAKVFAECLSHLGHEDVGSGIFLAVMESEHLLRDRPEIETEVLAGSVQSAGRIWGDPIAEGRSRDRPAVPLIVTFFSEFDDLASVQDRWGRHGLEPKLYASPATR
ncbi:hypothetical protein C5E02_05045 [Rathayibacter rathayi]|uniref:Barstar (barnase inhibitor) domain-containing protein n=1 Tax=Rathayibacter rathayi TaxID=33887 RepID=A0ABD6W565_RATRA|nr:barstar family protein [Rathayibacter rathayi]AZZ48674.1 hypothetical protein C1O28_05275 [Rathayibacter rathayi]MWV76087.1 hypothetical protein [Rathayibacter rathayi NCPPB 2980 = VKM Ac-1601]PPF09466.1 hypothetical protein C5C04_14765 [Rathayibacter rathayi]PPF41656.1 hypothetical protein C5C08_16030 [Rathayibacter rathayi]PPF72973.1 hypothetical protein C5C14_15885 [Rathayibacter rathayi]